MKIEKEKLRSKIDGKKLSLKKQKNTHKTFVPVIVNLTD